MSTVSTNAPLFIIGNPRSGTTLLRLMLSCHSRVLIPPECGYIIWLHAKYGQWRLSDCNDVRRINDFTSDLKASKKFETWSLSDELIYEHIRKRQPSTYASLCETVHGSYAASIGKAEFDIWGDKNNHYLNHLDELSGLYGQARYLHVVRDGRDVACSYREVMAAKSDSKYAPKLATGIKEIAFEWSSNVLRIDSFMSSRDRERVTTIRYEDLVSKPLQILSTLCDWLDLSVEPAMLEFHQLNASHRLEPERTLDWKRRTLQPVSDATVGRYVDLLGNDELSEFHEVASDALGRFSYS